MISENKYRAPRSRLTTRFYKLSAIGVIALIACSCNPARRVANGHYLLTRNIFRYRSGPANKNITSVLESSGKNLVAEITVPPEIAPEQLILYVKQKPNIKLLGLFPLHLWIYNIFDSAKTAQKKLARNQKIDLKYKKINEKRIEEGKLPISAAKIKAKKDKKTFREKVTGAGDHPVILDSTLLNSSRRQLSLFLADKGYYNCKVRDSVVVKKKKARVFYIIIPGKPYKISSVHYAFEDSGVAPAIYADTVGRLIRPGDNFDYDIFQAERDRITRNLNDEGFFAFGKEYVFFSIDSAIGNHKVQVTIDIRKFERPVKGNADSTQAQSHPQYHLRNVIIQMQYNPQDPPGSYKPSDTLKLDRCVMVYPGKKPAVRPKAMLNKIFLHEGALYRSSDVDNTYAGLGELRAFRYVNIKMVQPDPDVSLLDCYIQVMPLVRQAVGIEAEGNNAGGNLGIQGNIFYENKNCFRGGEDVQFKIRGGVEAQAIGSTTGQGTLGQFIPLNTVDLGGEFDFKIPRTLLFKKFFRNSPKDNPQNTIKVIYDYQNRPTFYNRELFGVIHEFNFFTTNSHNQSWSIKIPEVNYDKALLYPNFETQIEQTNNYFLQNSFSNHLITDLGFSWTLNNQVKKKDKSFTFVKFSAEESGLLLYAGDRIVYPAKDAYTIQGVPYSIYFKAELEARQYLVFSKDDRLVFRELIGYGLPLPFSGTGTYELPFDKSFWAGGSNDIRGFIARGLGPGENSNQSSLDEIGDEKFELNVEYRFNLIKFINLAIFYDAGNVWLRYNNPAIPNSNFQLDGPHSFINQLALSAGAGLRFDFTYFVVRLDFGFPWHDPGLDYKQFFNVKPLIDISRTVINLGIGYPF